MLYINTRWSGGVIRLNDRMIEGRMVWADGTRADFSNWNRGEPNDSGPGEDCVEIQPAGTWNDQACR